MENVPGINIDEFDYKLPDNRIAQYPSTNRDGSKLLVYNKGRLSEELFRNIPGQIPEKSMLVFNNTRVIKARLLFSKKSGAGIEVFCIDPFYPAEYSVSLRSKRPVQWRCIAGNLRKWKNEVLELKFGHPGSEVTLVARKVKLENDTLIVNFEWSSAEMTFGEILESAGHTPLPPYIKRNDTPDDSKWYQTVYSRESGSVAAPTAGLHFTDPVLSKLAERGISSCEITLHVGAGTFKPVKSDDIRQHEMHAERYSLSINDLIKIHREAGNIISVGTTSLRALESLFWLGLKIRKEGKPGSIPFYTDQWEPYYVQPDGLSYRESLESIIEHMLLKKISTLEAVTRIIIVPGYRFRSIKGLLTNFHQPRSTLLLLVAAWVGEDWKKIYRYALDSDFRFLSYGDSSILIR
jgi:S-adenosylmethionine:tRNA ribosyltransferase-isomerase